MRRDGLVVVTIVHEDGAKVAYNVDDEECDAILRLHGEVGTSCIAVDGVRGGRLHEMVVNLGGAA